jgi:putative spermidine/putrescine transport system ATP-binding protein
MFLEISNLRKSFGTYHAVQHFEMKIDKGEFISFLGPSGCGKTTTLRMIAGFETPTTGQIRVNSQDITGLRPNQRKIGMVFQSYALFPNMTVADNVAFGLKVAKKPADEIAQRVKEMLGLIGLPHLGNRYPFQLSGGQQQRVALARALAPKPQVLLLDEPLSALDAKIRVSLREEIRAVQRELGITTVYVTHDQEEALSMSDRIVVMNEGRVEQMGTPFEIYNRPKTRFVASFVGTLNMLKAQVLDAASGRVSIDGQEVLVATGLQGLRNGETCSLALRPEAVLLGQHGPERNHMNGTIQEVSFLGSVVRVRVRFHDNVVSLDTFNNPGMRLPERGQPVTVSFSREDLLLLEEAPKVAAAA